MSLPPTGTAPNLPLTSPQAFTQERLAWLFRDEPRPIETQKQTLIRGACLWGGGFQHSWTGFLGKGATWRSGMAQTESAADTGLACVNGTLGPARKVQTVGGAITG